MIATATKRPTKARRPVQTEHVITEELINKLSPLPSTLYVIDRRDVAKGKLLFPSAEGPWLCTQHKNTVATVFEGVDADGDACLMVRFDPAFASLLA